MDLIVYGVVTILLVGVFLLWKAGDYAVRYALQIATLYGFTTLFSGFVLMAISTGIPELAVVINSVLSNVGQMSAGVIIGSNVIDITLVLGAAILCAGPILVCKRDYANVIMIYLIATFAMVGVFLLGELSWYHGLFLIVTYFASLWWVWKARIALHGKVDELHEETKVVAKVGPRKRSKAKLLAILKFSASMVVTLLASKIVVFAAVYLAERFGMSLEAIGMTVVAIGTSLPELSLGINALRKKEYGLVLGNSLGSVLEQGTLILGVLALFSGKPINVVQLRSAAPFMFVTFAIIGHGIIKRKKMNRIEGFLLIIIFVLFIATQLIFMR